MKKEAKHIESLFKLLISKEKHLFPKTRKKINVPESHGVYIIYNPNGKVVYVGITKYGQNGLKNRFKNHLYGMSSFTKNYLNNKGSKLRNRYMYQFIEINEANDRKRLLLEAFATGKLCPAHIGTRKRKKKSKKLKNN